MIDKTPFRKYNEEKKTDTINVWLNQDDRTMLNHAQELLAQEKDSTVFKQLAKIGYAKLKGDKEISEIVDIVKNNMRKNKRLGVGRFD